jgi:hypothetical protein
VELSRRLLLAGGVACAHVACLHDLPLLFLLRHVDEHVVVRGRRKVDLHLLDQLSLGHCSTRSQSFNVCMEVR